MGPFLPLRTEPTLFPRLLQRTRSAWEHLGRPVTLPETPAQWQTLLSGRGPVEGPFDWSLSLGLMRTGRGRRLTPLGHLVEAWRVHAYPEAQEALAKLSREFLERVHAEFHFDLQAELPHGFESGTPASFAELAGEPASPELWHLGWASSYEKLPVLADVSERALALAAPVRGRSVLLTTPVFDRPELASGCVHLLRAQGAEWVGLLALASDVHGE